MLKSLFWMHKTTDEGWNQETSVILELITLFFINKTTDEIWDPLRLVILIQKSQMRAGSCRD